MNVCNQPQTRQSFPEEYLEVVKDTHETGGSTGSVGYGCQWKREEAAKNLLRTHTTAVSSQVHTYFEVTHFHLPNVCLLRSSKDELCM